MTGTPPTVLDLLSECLALGIKLAPVQGGGLTIDAPRGVLTPNLRDRLTANKETLRSLLLCLDADTVWQRTLDRLEGDLLFPPEVMQALRACHAEWGEELQNQSETKSEPVAAASGAVSKRGACRCGSTEWRDVPIHDGRSIRRDCPSCDRFIEFPVWYGNKHGEHGPCNPL